MTEPRRAHRMGGVGDEEIEDLQIVKDSSAEAIWRELRADEDAKLTRKTPAYRLRSRRQGR